MDSKLNSSSFASLKGHLLISMPQMDDSRFQKSVIFIGAHDSRGAMGLTINKPLQTIAFADVLDQVGVMSERPLDPYIRSMGVRTGGPVEESHGFLLHSADFRQKDTILIDDFFGISGTVDALRTMVSGYRPERMIFTLGYAGWSAGQLEQEMQDNVWLSVPASPELVFNTDPDNMWENAFAILGISPGLLSASAGRA